MATTYFDDYNHFDPEREIQRWHLDEVDEDQINTDTLIKEGGFSKVYKHYLRDQLYALKQLKTKEYKWNVKEICHSEVAILKNLNPPTDVDITSPTYDPRCTTVVFMICYSTTPRQPVIILEHISGMNMYDFKINKHLDQIVEFEKASLAWQLANGMAYVHTKKCLHRDLKPTNIMIMYNMNLPLKGQRLEVKIIDFGLATMEVGKEVKSFFNQKFIKTLHPGPLRLRQAPERTKYPFERASDVYMCGFLFYDILKGFCDNIGRMNEVTVTCVADHEKWLKRVVQTIPMDNDRTEFFKQFRLIVLRMIQFDRNYRPTFEEVVDMIKVIIISIKQQIAATEISGTESGGDTSQWGLSDGTLDSRPHHHESLQSLESFREERGKLAPGQKGKTVTINTDINEERNITARSSSSHSRSSSNPRSSSNSRSQRQSSNSRSSNQPVGKPLTTSSYNSDSTLFDLSSLSLDISSISINPNPIPRKNTPISSSNPSSSSSGSNRRSSSNRRDPSSSSSSNNSSLIPVRRRSSLLTTEVIEEQLRPEAHRVIVTTWSNGPGVEHQRIRSSSINANGERKTLKVDVMQYGNGHITTQIRNQEPRY